MDNNYEELKLYCRDTAGDIELAVRMGNFEIAASLMPALEKGIKDLIAERERLVGDE